MWPQDVTKKDLRIDKYRGSGAGGQNKNKRDTAIRITHLPTGIIATGEDQRTQGQNLKNAFRRLAAKLIPIMKASATLEKPHNTEEVRVYREKDRIVKDKRLETTFDYYAVLNGNQLDEIIDDLVGK
jgi:peptide chain release factor 1